MSVDGDPVSIFPVPVSTVAEPLSELLVSAPEKFVFVSSVRLDWLVEGTQARENPKRRLKTHKFFIFRSGK